MLIDDTQQGTCATVSDCSVIHTYSRTHAHIFPLFLTMSNPPHSQKTHKDFNWWWSSIEACRKRVNASIVPLIEVLWPWYTSVVGSTREAMCYTGSTALQQTSEKCGGKVGYRFALNVHWIRALKFKRPLEFRCLFIPERLWAILYGKGHHHEITIKVCFGSHPPPTPHLFIALR